ncbi:polysaccharide chain length determinant protein [gamma proteobacterium NOR5-3]|nr:polysaccharide chain length determinant protein [gamma proteobacterium NOR5-3]
MRGLAITPDINQRMSMMSRTLLSRPNLEKLARMTDLDLTATNEQQQEQLTNRLKQTISLTGDRRNTSLYDISVKNQDRDVARRIAQALITVFIESSLNDKRDDSSGAQDFLDEQIADYERRLIEAEGRLARFKQQNVDLLPGEGGDYYSRLEMTREQLREARLLLDEMQNRRDELQRQLSGESSMSFDSLVNSGLMTPTEARIQQLRLRLDDLLSRYTDKHPEVRQIRGLMEELETQRETELQALRDSGSTAGSMAASPLYQDMRGMLAEAEAGVAELKVRVSEFERRASELTERVNQIPEIEAQLKQLDRDYAVVQNQHEELLERRESARISQDVENNAGDVNFRVIDPPFVPSTPSEPNKLLLNAGVLIVALGAGGALALLLSLLNPIVVDARMLAETTGLPLLGVVTNNKSPEQERSDYLRLGTFAACLLLLLAMFAGVLAAPDLIERVASL